jgi:D-hexose-6-phosphate mutarotase
VPLCFPWFGPRKDPAGNPVPGAPAHGFARLLPWSLDTLQKSPAGLVITLSLRATHAERETWPHDFLLRHHITVGRQLTMALELTNAGTAPFTAEEAQHTYFSVGDVRRCALHGLAGTRYLDKVDGAKEKTQDGPIAITAETDRVYLDTAAPVTVDDPVKRRRIRIEKENSAATVVWNPWVAKAKAMPDFGDDEWPAMLCVETCNVAAHALTLPPGRTHTMSTTITVEPL